MNTKDKAAKATVRKQKRKTAKKRQIIQEKQNRTNNRIKSGILNKTRKVFLLAKTQEEKEKYFKELTKIAQKSSSNKLIKKNKASRIISRAYKILKAKTV